MVQDHLRVTAALGQVNCIGKLPAKEAQVKGEVVMTEQSDVSNKGFLQRETIRFGMAHAANSCQRVAKMGFNPGLEAMRILRPALRDDAEHQAVGRLEERVDEIELPLPLVGACLHENRSFDSGAADCLQIVGVVKGAMSESRNTLRYCISEPVRIDKMLMGVKNGDVHKENSRTIASVCSPTLGEPIALANRSPLKRMGSRVVFMASPSLRYTVCSISRA